MQLGALVAAGPISAALSVRDANGAEPSEVRARPTDQAVATKQASELGARSSYAHPKRTPGLSTIGSTSATPIQDLFGTITPSDLHYEVHHSGIPTIVPTAYKLLLHGLVARPRAFTLDDLQRLPSETRTCFIECAGNYPVNAPPTATPQDLAGLMSQSEWTGVPLRVLFDEVGLRPNARWFLAEGGDPVHLDRSIPVEKGLDDALVAYAQNGEALRPGQGYPVRLVLPGWEGNTNIKWLRRLKLGEAPFMTRWETSRYSDGLPDGRIRQFSFVLDARSIITRPAAPQQILPGWLNISGLAWSGRGRIARVDVSMDGGTTWQAADLQGPVLPKAQTRFGTMWRWDGNESVLMSRAVDETGYVQPTVGELLAVRGRATGPYHLNPIVAWRVPRDGRIQFRTEKWG
jgi:sulfane dehydrogenase subunit SoxC